MQLADRRTGVRNGHAFRYPHAASARDGRSSLIRIGRVVFPHQAGLARQALGKIGRCWSGDVEAYQVHDRDRGSRDLPPLDGCSVLATDAFAPLLGWHLRAGRVFVPTASEASAELALYALASGVPLDALCFDRVSTPTAGGAGETAALHGEIFLKVVVTA